MLVAKQVSRLLLVYKSSKDPNDQSTLGGNFITFKNNSLCVFELKANSILARPTLALFSPPTHDHVVLKYFTKALYFFLAL